MKKILAVLGVICILYGLGVNAIVSGKGWFNFVFCFAGIFLIIISLIWDYILALPLLIKAVLAIVLILCLVNFGIAEGRIIKTANSLPDEDAKWVTSSELVNYDFAPADEFIIDSILK